MKKFILMWLYRLLRIKPKKSDETGRLQYMLEWREKAVNRYKQALDGADEEIRILSAYLVSLADRLKESGEIRISKDEISMGIENKYLTFRDGGDCYVLFVKSRDEDLTPAEDVK